MTCDTRGRAACGLLLALLGALPVSGQEPDKPTAQPTPAPTPTPRVSRRVAAPTFALGAGGPLLASASAGVILGTDRSLPDECPSPRGWLLQAEGGLGGVKLSGGPAFTYCQTVFGSLGAAALQATWARTWGRPLGTEPDLSYVGGELDIGLIDWRVTLGLLKRTGTATEGANWLFTWGIARGF
ncbi:MAG TPA: hypothetical protein VMT87_16410 [Vicinamibacteria bacterium]|nr:hypothetical protein [Vicinamibacteria bacterium]